MSGWPPGLWSSMAVTTTAAPSTWLPGSPPAQRAARSWSPRPWPWRWAATVSASPSSATSCSRASQPRSGSWRPAGCDGPAADGLALRQRSAASVVSRVGACSAGADHLGTAGAGFTEAGGNQVPALAIDPGSPSPGRWRGRLHTLLERVAAVAVLPDDPEEVRVRKASLILLIALIVPLSTVWVV